MSLIELEDDGSAPPAPASSPSAGAKAAEEEKKFWLNAYKDHLAGVKCFSSCIELADVNGDGDFKLIIADAQRRLKVFSGTSLVNDSALMTVPAAVASFYMDYRDEVRRPNVAVASGAYIFIYKNLRPYYKFGLPPVELPEVDVRTWSEVKKGAMTPQQAFEALEAARDSGEQLSTRSIDFLGIDNERERNEFVQQHGQQPLVQQTVITCMVVLNKDKDDSTGLGCLVVGTENRFVLILDNTGASVQKKIQLPSTPVHLMCAGLLDVEYRVIAACRNGSVYCIKNGTLQGVVIEPEAQVVGLCRYDNLLAIGTMANALHYFHLKGKKQSTVYLPSAITNMTTMIQEATNAAKAVVVALANGEVRVYAGKTLINKTQVHDVVTGMRYGRYGREDSTLVLIMKSGSIVMKILPRTASLEPNKAAVAGPPPEQDVPLKVPKRTNLYVEQTEREKQFSVDMHRVFQRDLCKLRLNTARAYVKMLTDKQGTMSYNSSTSLRLTAHVQGLGPLFKVKLNVQNVGTKALTGVPVVFTYSMDVYRLPQPYLFIPNLVPSLIYNFEVPVECVDENAGADVVRVCVCSPTSSVPIITALVNMPVADFLMTQ